LSYNDIIDYLSALRQYWHDQAERIVLKIETARTLRDQVEILRQYIKAEPRFGPLGSTPEDILRTQLRLIIQKLKKLECGELPEQPKAVKDFLEGKPLMNPVKRSANYRK
jgi:hypothetical protein